MIFQILEKLVTAIAEHKDREEVGKALAFLSVYVESNFKLGEELMYRFTPRLPSREEPCSEIVS